MKIGFDFDDTLATDRGKELAKRLISEGNEVYIVTRRQESALGPVKTVAEELGIPLSRVFATNGSLKWEKVQELGLDRFYDNNQNEIDHINQNTTTRGIKFMETKKFDEETDFISECIGKLVGEEGYSQEQATAICYSKWENMNADEKGIWKAAKFFKIMNLKK